MFSSSFNPGQQKESSRARCGGESPSDTGDSGYLREPPPCAGTERPRWPVRSPGWVHRHRITSCRGPAAPPRAEHEQKEPEGEKAEREAEKGAGVRMYEGGQITCE
ncbi:uncharacterized protein ACIB01_003302 [Guaruba guarouba]